MQSVLTCGRSVGRGRRLSAVLGTGVVCRGGPRTANVRLAHGSGVRCEARRPRPVDTARRRRGGGSDRPPTRRRFVLFDTTTVYCPSPKKKKLIKRIIIPKKIKIVRRGYSSVLAAAGGRAVGESRSVLRSKTRNETVYASAVTRCGALAVCRRRSNAFFG